MSRRDGANEGSEPPSKALLLVDDDAHVCAALKRALAREDYRIHVAHSAADAMRILSEHPIDVVMSDQQMPGKKGTELLKEVKELYPNTIRLILSGAADSDDVATAMEAGAIYKFLTKPIHPGLLRANVDEAFSRAASVRWNEAATVSDPHPATGLPTEHQLKRLFTKLVEKARSQGRGVCLFILKPDQYQRVVGSFGSSAGQSFLREVGHRLSRYFPDHLLGHGPHESFVMLAVADDPFEHIARMDAQLGEWSTQPIRLAETSITVTLIVGASAAHRDPRSFDELVDEAHVAMMADSDRGGAMVQVFQPQLVSTFRDELQLESDLRQAIEAESFEIHYQPQVEVSSGRIVGLEALLRWPQPDGRLVSPGVFIPMAERLMLIDRIGAWVLQEAIEQFLIWHRAGLAPDELAINLSPLQLRHASFVDKVDALLAGVDLQPPRLVLEVTESAAIEQEREVVDCLQALHALGVTLAVDDFGAGYANLGVLTRLPFKKLKIDRSLLPRAEDRRSRRLFGNVVAMAHELGLAVLAEGVETPLELGHVHDAGCTVVQGFFYSPPVSAARLSGMLGQKLA